MEQVFLEKSIGLLATTLFVENWVAEKMYFATFTQT